MSKLFSLESGLIYIQFSQFAVNHIRYMLTILLQFAGKKTGDDANRTRKQQADTSRSSAWDGMTQGDETANGTVSDTLLLKSEGS